MFSAICLPLAMRLCKFAASGVITVLAVCLVIADVSVVVAEGSMFTSASAPVRMPAPAPVSVTAPSSVAGIAPMVVVADVSVLCSAPMSVPVPAPASASAPSTCGGNSIRCCPRFIGTYSRGHTPAAFHSRGYLPSNACLPHASLVVCHQCADPAVVVVPPVRVRLCVRSFC